MGGKGVVTKQYLSDIAAAIRDKLGEATLYKPAEMADSIEDIDSPFSRKVVFFDKAKAVAYANNMPTKYGEGFQLSQSYAIRGDNNRSDRLAISWSNNVPYAYRNGYGSQTAIFDKQLPNDKYSKIYLECSIENYGSATYRHAEVRFAKAFAWTQYGQPTDSYKSYVLADIDKTVAQITQQTGITINPSSNTTLSRQVVEMVIPDTSILTGSWYLAIWNCDVTINIFDLYIE